MCSITSAELATWQRCDEAARPALPGVGQCGSHKAFVMRFSWHLIVMSAEVKLGCFLGRE